MPKKQSKTLTPEQVAERERPSWKVVQPYSADVSRRVAADAFTPELDELQQKYAPSEKPVKRRKRPANSDTKMLLMEPKTPTDSRTGRMAVLVSGDKVVGEQG